MELQRLSSLEESTPEAELANKVRRGFASCFSNVGPTTSTGASCPGCCARPASGAWPRTQTISSPRRGCHAVAGARECQPGESRPSRAGPGQRGGDRAAYGGPRTGRNRHRDAAARLGMGAPRWMTGARSSSACARRASTRSRTSSRAWPGRCMPPMPSSSPARRPSRLPRRRPAWRRGAVTGGAAFLDVVDRSGPHPGARAQGRARRRVVRAPDRTRPRRPDRRRRHRLQHQARRADAAGRGWALLAKSLRAPPEKYHGLEDVETRYRHRELDLIANEETRELFILRSQVVSRDPPLARRAGLPRGRDADAAAALRRRARAPFTTHHNALDRDLYLRIADRALPEAADRRRPRARLRDRQGLPQRGRLAQAQPRVHDARVVRGVRGLRRHRERARGAGLVRGRRGRATTAPIDFSRAVEAGHAARRDPRGDRHRRLEPATRRARRRGERASSSTRRHLAKLVDDLLSKHVEPKLDEPDVRHGLPGGAVAVRQGPPLRARAWSSASSASRRAWSSRTRSPS